MWADDPEMALGRKNAVFTGADRVAIVATLSQTAKLHVGRLVSGRSKRNELYTLFLEQYVREQRPSVEVGAAIKCHVVVPKYLCVQTADELSCYVDADHPSSIMWCKFGKIPNCNSALNLSLAISGYP
jgi:hypothetical protein